MKATKLDHLHSEIETGPDEVVQVTLAGNEANVLLLDDENYALYSNGAGYTYRAGGHFRRSPAVLQPPGPGRWHVVVDLGGAAGHITASVTVRPAAAPS